MTLPPVQVLWSNLCFSGLGCDDWHAQSFRVRCSPSGCMSAEAADTVILFLDVALRIRCMTVSLRQSFAERNRENLALQSVSACRLRHSPSLTTIAYCMLPDQGCQGGPYLDIQMNTDFTLACSDVMPMDMPAFGLTVLFQV